MSTRLKDESNVIKTIKGHLLTGTPINEVNYPVNSFEMERIKAVFTLFKAWKNNPLVDKRLFLQHVMHRRPQDIPNDLFCFEYIRENSQLMLTKDDMRFVQQQAILDAMQSARQNGESQQLLKAAKQLGELSKEMPDTNKLEMDEELSEFYSTDIRDIAPDYKPVSTNNRRQMLGKYGGTPDYNTTMVEQKILELRESNDEDV